jgi:pimeloyl-ACP methyl ester carboxylesterase
MEPNNIIERIELARPACYTSAYIEAAELRLHYLDYGSAGKPPVICLHGAAAHAHWFDFIATGFTADYHVLALDHRGHGDSDWCDPSAYSYERYAADLGDVANKLDLKDFVLIGHSMGGMVSLIYTAANQRRVSKLIVVDSMLRITEELAANYPTVGSRGENGYSTREEFVERYRLRPPSTNIRSEVLAHLAQNSVRQTPEGRWRYKFDRNVYAKRKAIDGLPYWGRIDIPVLLVKGERSTRITHEIVAEVKAQCPQVEVAEVFDSGHHVTVDNPKGFVDAVCAFLARHS